MSRLSSAKPVQIALRRWLRIDASRVSIALVAACSALCLTTGCSSVGGTNLLKSPIANSPETAAMKSGGAANAPVSLSLRDDAPAIRQPNAAYKSEVTPVSYHEPIASARSVPGSSVPVSSLTTATQASYQMAAPVAVDSCAAGCNNSVCSTNSSGCGCGGQCEAGCANVQGQNLIDQQEYVFDGGDLDPALVVRKDRSIAGLNPTDTVAYYETYDGKLCITPTNRVPIYAPRFGAVRQVTGVVLSEHALATERILAPVAPSCFEDKNLVSSMVKPVAPQGEDKVSLIDAFRDRNGGVPLAQVIPPHRMSDAIVPFEAVDFFRTGVLKHEDLAVLGQFFQNAKVWETPESLEVLVDGQEAAIARDAKQAQDVHVYELPPGKCSLRICKAASHMIADSGDQITFTIRFDNIGAQPIEKVVIVDSLSPRLEYIEESQQSSVAPTPEFSATPNDVGSTVLRWELKSPIKPGEGGALHFRCLVR